MEKIKTYKTGLMLSLTLILTLLSCAVSRQPIVEDEIVASRRYVGNFIRYEYASPNDYGWPNTEWIVTTKFGVYGRISAYSNGCRFSPGDRLYIRKVGDSPMADSYWSYQIENESNVNYKLSEFQDGNQLLARSFR
jgi:hypothetical protein